MGFRAAAEKAAKPRMLLVAAVVQAEIAAGTDPNDPNSYPGVNVPLPMMAMIIAAVALLAAGMAVLRGREERRRVS